MFLSGFLKAEGGGKKSLHISRKGHMARMRACDGCSKRKIQCDRAEPYCNWCSHHGLACTFNRPMRKTRGMGNTKDNKYSGSTWDSSGLPGSSTIPQSSAHLDGGLQSLSPLTIQNSPGNLGLGTYHDTGSTHNKTPTGSGATLGHIHFAGHHLGDINPYNGLPLFQLGGRSWIQSRTGVDALKLASPPWHNHHVQTAISSPISDPELPARKTTDYYFSFYCQSEFRLAFPVVDTVLFVDIIELAYRLRTEADTLEYTAARACVHSFLAVVSLIEGSLEEAPIDSHACAAKVQYALPQLLTENSNVTLQICYMQCLYHLMTGKFQTAGMFHSIACRMTFILGCHMHEEPPVNGTQYGLSEEPWRIKKHLRQLFWLCYMADTDISLRTGQPLAIDDRNCDLTLPKHYQTANVKSMSVNDEYIPIFPGDIRLNIIKSKTIRKLYSMEALRNSDAEVLRAIRELDDELEEWRLSLPTKIRPTLSSQPYASGITKIKNPHQRMRFTVINFEYLFTITSIHRATGRCQAWSHIGSQDKDAVNSSLVLSVEASRSTLNFLRLSVQNSLRESFWMLMFYPMSAVLTLFCNLLLNPLCPQACQDLELLNATPELFKRMRTRHLTLTEDSHLNMVETFIADLTRLGRSAIEKAHTRT